MGYNTYYIVEIKDIPPKCMENICSELDSFLDDIWENSSIFVGGSYYGKWYNWEKDLLNLSSEYPEIFITVDGDGEARDDFWRAFIKDGAIQYSCGHIVYDEYDPEKMKVVNPPHLVEHPTVGDLL